MICQIGICEGEDCGKKRYIVNKKYWYCQECNHKRLHGENAIKEKQARQAKLMGSVKNFNKAIKAKSLKQIEADKEIHKVYAEMDAEDNQFCTGCGNPNSLSHSHIIPRSRRKDLEAVRKNLTWHCLVRQDGSEGCHQRHETTEKRIELLDYEKNMEYIKRVDPEYYHVIKYKERDLGLK